MTLTDQQYQDLRSLMNHAGWQAMSFFIQSLIEKCQTDLERRNFASLAEAALVQGNLRALRIILNYPRTRVEAFERKNLQREEK